VLLGGFNGTRPLLPGFVIFPNLNASGQVIFLVDTGADVSLIGPGDCVALGLEPQLNLSSPHVQQAPTVVSGICGSVQPYLVEVYLFFPQRDEEGDPLPDPYCRVGTIDVLTPAMMPTPDPQRWPMSCLGWDVLQQMEHIDFHLGGGKVLFHLPA
jgi:hypothetical protein